MRFHAYNNNFHAAINSHRHRTENRNMLIIAIKPCLSRSSCVLWWNAAASFVLGKSSFGISFPRNLHSGSQPSTTFHSSNLSGGTRPLIIAQCSRYIHFPLTSIPLLSDESVQRKSRDHNILWWQWYIHHSVGWNQHSHTVQVSLIAVQRFLTALACHRSRSRTLRMTFASGYAPMSSAAKHDAAASVTATEWPNSSSNSAAVIVQSPVLSPYHFLRVSRTQACIRWGSSKSMSHPWSMYG